MGAAHVPRPLHADREALEHAGPKLIERLRAEPFDYFRFVNGPWIERVCDAFAANVRDVPEVRLHGDAHVEQFAITKDAGGLDDFDDSARGPAVIDIVRFLGSIDLVTRQRSWEEHRDALFDRFFAGYKRGLLQPDYLPPAPDIVRRLRAEAPATRVAFLEWGESKMRPLSEPAMKAVTAAMAAFGRIVLSEGRALSREYFRVVRAGWLEVGIGSAVSPKILIRVRGASENPLDDELLELKKISDFGGQRCLHIPTTRPTLRIIDGSKQLGRLKHNIMVAGPELAIPEVIARGQHVRDWWIRSLEPSYRQLQLSDLRSVGDLTGIVYDAGVQLGGGRLRDRTVSLSSLDRKRMLTATGGLEKRYREQVSRLVDDLLRGWRELRTQ
jgi:hypothetical protein